MIYENLKTLLERRNYVVHGVKTGPYNVTTITKELDNELEHIGALAETDLMFNLTGGTKTMSFAAYQIAARHHAPVLYFQSEGSKSIVDHYHWQNHQLVHLRQDSLAEHLHLRDMLDLHLGIGKDAATGKNHWEEKGPTIQLDTHSHLFEMAIAQALQDDGYEVMRGVKGERNQIDIDVMIGYRNQVGIIEAKTSKTGSVCDLDGVKQLSTVMRYLRGTYIKQFLVVAGKASSDLQMVSDIVKTHLISLPGYRRGPEAISLSPEDKDNLLETVKRFMKIE